LLWIDFGGGLKSDEDVRIAFESGAQQITGGTIAVKDPAIFQNWLERYGSEKIILGADVKNGSIAVSGWQEESGLELHNFLKDYQEKGVQYTICTDVAKDGLLQGPAIELYQEILENLSELQLIASGGVTTVDDLHQLQDVGCFGAIVGKAIYEGNIQLQELQQFA